MHEIILKHLAFSNVLSYGANLNEISFVNGVSWIKGPNGSGKSTVIEALTFALFKVPYRGINNSELRNSANKGKLRVDLEFERHDNKGVKHYRVVREMSKAGSISTEITVDGVMMPKEAGYSQKMFEDEVLGFNKNIFDNVISLNTIETTPFIDMEPTKKRKLMESGLTLHIEKFKEENKKALKEAKLKVAVYENEVRSHISELSRYEDLIKQLVEEQRGDIDALKKRIEGMVIDKETINSQIAEIDNEIKSIIDAGKLKKAELDALGDADEQKMLQIYQEALGYLNIIDQLKESVAQYKTAFDDSEINKNSAERSLAEYTEAHPDLDPELYKTIQTRESTNTKKLIKLDIEIERITSRMSEIESEAKSIKVGVPCATCGKPSVEADVEPIKAKYRANWKELKGKLEDANVTRTELNSQIEQDTDALANMKEYQQQYDVLVRKYKDIESEWTSAKRMYENENNRIKEINKKLEQLIIMIDGGEVTVELVTTRIDQMKSVIQTKSTLSDELSDLKIEHGNKTNDKKVLLGRIKSIDDEIGRVNDDIEQLEAKKNSGSIAKAQEEKDKIDGQLKDAKADLLKWNDEVAMTEYIEKMYNDDGIKKIVLSIFVPNLNDTIAHNFKLFNIPFMLEFDDGMEHKFASRYGLAQVYHGLSQGQKRKLNFAIAIAFRDFITAIADFKINILFLDEVLDISTDEEALGQMIDLLKNKVSEIGGIYVMTHRGENFSDSFDHIVDVEHDGTYSSLVQKKI